MIERALGAAQLWALVTDSAPEGTAATDTEGLRIRRYTAMGFAIGGLVAAAVFVRFVLLPGTARSMGLYLGLALVLWVSIGLLATILLVAWRVRRLARAL